MLYVGFLCFYRWLICLFFFFFFFSSRRRHTRCSRDWSSDVCSSDLADPFYLLGQFIERGLAVLGEELLRELLEDHGARILDLVDPVAEPHDRLLLLQLGVQVRTHALDRADLAQHGHDFLIGPAV